MKSIGLTEKVINRYEPHAAKGKDDEAESVSTRYNLHGPIIDDLMASLVGEIGGICFPQQLRSFLDSNAGNEIEININSPGGHVWDATSMFGDLMRHDGKVNVVVSGACLSAATHFLGLPNANRVSMPGSEFMIHDPWTVAIGGADVLRKAAESLEKSAATIAKRLSARMNSSADEVRSLMAAETWFTDEEALEAGLVDSIFEMQVERKGKEEKTEVKNSGIVVPEAVVAAKSAARAGYQKRQLRGAR